MYQTSTLTLQMFISAGGLNVLVEFLDEDYETARDLVLIGVNGIWNVFDLQGPTPKNDFCRIFSRSRILDPLADVLRRVLDEAEDGRDEYSELIEGRIVNIFYLFSQAENYVKEVVADRHVLKSVLEDLRRMTPVHRITMLKFIKNLSMLSTTLDSLHSADAIDFLIAVLKQNMGPGCDQKHFRDLCNQVLNTLFNLCRLSKDRQEYAALKGIIPLLLAIMQTDRPPKEFALPILCDMAHSGSKGRRYLWQNGGLDFYISLLADQYWQVTALDAIFVWLQEETAKVEAYLLSTGTASSPSSSSSSSSANSSSSTFSNAIVACFYSAARRTSSSTSLSSSTSTLPAAAAIVGGQPVGGAFDSNLLEPLLKLLRLSPALAATLARPDMFAGIAHRLAHKKAVVRLNLLRLVRTIMDAARWTVSDDTSSPGNVSQSGPVTAATTTAAASLVLSGANTQLRNLFDVIQGLAERDSAVLVRNLASELVRSHVTDLERISNPSDSSVASLVGPTSQLSMRDEHRSANGTDRAGSANGSLAQRPPQRLRRTTSYASPPSLHGSFSMPPPPPRQQQHSSRQTPLTPTHHRSQSHHNQQYNIHHYHDSSHGGSRSQQQQHHPQRPSLTSSTSMPVSSSSTSYSYIEVASTPTSSSTGPPGSSRRSQAQAVADREQRTALYRPRSRDGGGAAATGIPRRVSGAGNDYYGSGAAALVAPPGTPTGLGPGSFSGSASGSGLGIHGGSGGVNGMTTAGTPGPPKLVIGGGASRLPRAGRGGNSASPHGSQHNNSGIAVAGADGNMDRPQSSSGSTMSPATTTTPATRSSGRSDSAASNKENVVAAAAAAASFSASGSGSSASVILNGGKRRTRGASGASIRERREESRWS